MPRRASITSGLDSAAQVRFTSPNPPPMDQHADDPPSRAGNSDRGRFNTSMMSVNCDQTMLSGAGKAQNMDAARNRGGATRE
jgi:hypothetical protein